MSNPAISRDLTAADLSSHMGPVGNQSGLLVAFFWNRVQIKSKDFSKNGTFENRLCVAKQPKGDRLTVAHRTITPEEAARQFPREYALFSQYEDVPTDGTPLSDLPGISRSQIAILDMHAIRCVEDLCDISDDVVAQIGMEASRTRKIAVAWMAKRDGEAETIKAADVQARAESALAAMEKRLALLETQNVKLEAQNQAMRSMGGNAAQQAPAGGVESVARVSDDAPYKLDENDGFMGGGDPATGNDDLGADDLDPLKD